MISQDVERSTTLYRLFDRDGQLLYVGVTSQPLRRLAAHNRTAQWFDSVVRFEFTRFTTRTEALAAEAEAIDRERPLFNLRGAGIEPHTLRSWRSRRGWSQTQLAERAGISAALVGLVEVGQRRLSPKTAAAIASALGTTAAALVTESGEVLA